MDVLSKSIVTVITLYTVWSKSSRKLTFTRPPRNLQLILIFCYILRMIRKFSLFIKEKGLKGEL